MKIRTILLAAVPLALGAVAATGTPSMAAPAPHPSVHAAGHATAAGTTKGVTPFVGLFNPIKNVGDNKCLQPASPVVGSGVVQEPCDNSTAQGWQFNRVAKNHYQLENQLSGLCLWAFGDPAANGNPMGLNTCGTASNEEFNTNTSLPNVVILESRTGFHDTGFCVDVPGSQPTDGLGMQLFECNGTLAQRWVVGFS